jgi:hypothetical protein
MGLDSAWQAKIRSTLAAEQSRMLLLSQKIARLKASPSPDPLQQLQTETILDLYDAVKRMQDELWPLMATLPDTGAVRDAAAKAIPRANAMTKPGKFF